MSVKMWKHEGRWRFMATLGKTHRAVLQVPFDADESEAQAIADAEVDGVTGIPATHHPWEVKAEEKPKAAKAVEWEYRTTSVSREFGTPEVIPLPPGDGPWEPIGATTCLLPGQSPALVCHFFYWERPKP